MKVKQLAAALAAFTMGVAGTAGVLPGVPAVGTVLTAKAGEYNGLEYEEQEGEPTLAITGCDKTLTSVEIPAEIDGTPVTSIRWLAFSECWNLTSVTIPDSVTSIGTYAFYNCTRLTEITIPNGVTSIEDSTFNYCTGLTEITIPDSVTSIGKKAFSNCTSLKSITIPDSVTSIGDSAFYFCTSLKSITIPDSVTSIGNSAFYVGLKEITILNPDCEIDTSANTISKSATIHGYEGSTAQAYAEAFGNPFVSLGEAPVLQPLYGDANDDGEVTIVDVVKLCRCTMGADTLTKTGAVNADVDGNGTADATDASYIIQSLVGLVILPVVAGT